MRNSRVGTLSYKLDQFCLERIFCGFPVQHLFLCLFFIISCDGERSFNRQDSTLSKGSSCADDEWDVHIVAGHDHWPTNNITFLNSSSSGVAHTCVKAIGNRVGKGTDYSQLDFKFPKGVQVKQDGKVIQTYNYTVAVSKTFTFGKENATVKYRGVNQRIDTRIYNIKFFSSNSAGAFRNQPLIDELSQGSIPSSGIVERQVTQGAGQRTVAFFMAYKGDGVQNPVVHLDLAPPTHEVTGAGNAHGIAGRDGLCSPVPGKAIGNAYGLGGFLAQPAPANKHIGVDVFGAWGAQLVAVEDGAVVNTGGAFNGGYGSHVIVIDHGLDGNNQRWLSLYAHASQSLVQVGQKVRRGQPIAVIGLEGAVFPGSDPHVHMDILKMPAHRNWPMGWDEWVGYTVNPANMWRTNCI